MKNIDGVARSEDAEKQINEAIALAFKGKSGELALKYLRSISIERVMGPNFDPNSLAHLEGQRFIVGVIEQRIKQAQKGDQP